jgi:ABC-type polysaccharide/polyol phosphate export permease
MGLLLYVTPIIYAETVDSQLVQVLITINPLTYLVGSARDIVLYGRLYEPTGFVISAALSFFLFMISWRLFYVSEDKLIERMI